MRRTDRLLGIILRLRGGKVVTAHDLGRHFEVSERTIYRDIDALSALGVPVYAEQGRCGGFRLLEGYVLPAIAFSQEEAVSLLLGLTVLERMRSRPFASGLETATAKLLAAMPRHLSEQLSDAETFIGVERSATNAFHHGLVEPPPPDPASESEQSAIDTFLSALLDGDAVELDYRSPFRPSAQSATAHPRGLFWDRDRWYLVGDRLLPAPGRRLWRADRVISIRRAGRQAADSHFDIRALLGRAWLDEAMENWAAEAPVRIRLTPAQAERLHGDWYYGHARYDEQPDGSVVVTFGQDEPAIVVELLRWLGPGAELLEPAQWRAAIHADLLRMLAVYHDTSERAPARAGSSQ